jgi:transcriptional regulator with XRE-family HTH domain
MPQHSDCLSAHSRREFCLALKAARERKGVALSDIARETKIPASLFAGLERNDPRFWPTGLYRRSFFRGYAAMIGVPLAEACAEFAHWFPDDEGAPSPKPAAAATTDAERPQRLALDAAWHGPRTSVLPRFGSALIDAVAVIFVATALAWAAGSDWPATIAVVALTYFSLSTVLLDQSPGKWLRSKDWPSILEVLTQGRTAITTVFETAGGGIAAPPDEPTHPPPLRVRIKLSP